LLARIRAAAHAVRLGWRALAAQSADRRRDALDVLVDRQAALAGYRGRRMGAAADCRFAGIRGECDLALLDARAPSGIVVLHGAFAPFAPEPRREPQRARALGGSGAARARLRRRMVEAGRARRPTVRSLGVADARRLLLRSI